MCVLTVSLLVGRSDVLVYIQYSLVQVHVGQWYEGRQYSLLLAPSKFNE